MTELKSVADQKVLHLESQLEVAAQEKLSLSEKIESVIKDKEDL